VTTLLVTALSMALYLVFAGTVSTSELIAAILVGILATLWAYLVQRHSEQRFRYTMELNILLPRMVRLVVQGTYRTTIALLKSALTGISPGKALRVDFEPGPRDSATDRTRRALAVLAASLAPDSFVVRLDRGRETLVHSITNTNSKRGRRLLT
jgi:multisubunit Na+/H+ antiporter MnhE subunit